MLAAVSAVGTTSQAQAALYYWQAEPPALARTVQAAPQRHPGTRRHHTKKAEPVKEGAKPQGPLVIAISINKQTLKIYDANGVFAESPVSTGMPGHSTPMGVFSVIQKQKLHHSNIYSGAPMPFMQRITWSGIAMHAGVLPGRPASHGCIRLPMAFAVKMFGWTRMGARVVITPGEMSPASFTHPLLASLKVAPQPVSATEPTVDAPPAVKSDKAADASPAAQPVTSASLELRSTVGHDDVVRPVMQGVATATPLREQTHTADASADMPGAKPLTMSDAGGGNPSPRAETASAVPAAPEASAAVAAERAEAEHTEIAETKPAETSAPEATAEAAPAAVQTIGEATSAETAAAIGAAAEETKVEAKVETKVDAKPDNKPLESLTTATTVPPPSIPDGKKDQGRMPGGVEKAVTARPDPAIAATAAPKRSGQISVFISRKDAKLYVRQNFAPLFDVPVTIVPSDRPLGTHVFTAQIDKDDANVVHWSVVSLPAAVRSSEKRVEVERPSHRRKVAAVVEPKAMPAPDSPTEALDRLTIPKEAMARIVDTLTTGGSIVVSDQGIAAGETGEGTDFIVALR